MSHCRKTKNFIEIHVFQRFDWNEKTLRGQIKRFWLILISQQRLIMIGLIGWAVMGVAPSHGWAIPQVGKKAADQYFLKRKQKSWKSPSGVDHYLTLHGGVFYSDKAYQWGHAEKDEKGIGNLTTGVSYRIGQWVGSMDLLIRADLITFHLDETQLKKMSLLPLIAFPEANSRFPLYFGGGIGLGVFFEQIDKESPISLDYQLFAGIRLFELIGSMGLTFEFGMKNHLHLLSDGQYSGTFASMGFLFTF